MKISLVSVPVSNPNEAFKFYTQVLGFVERMHIPEAYLAVVASPEEPNGTSLLLEPNNNPIAKAWQEGVYNAGLPLIVFGTDDIQRECQTLKDRGVVFRQEPTPTDWGTIEAVFEDTCGNLIQIAQRV